MERFVILWQRIAVGGQTCARCGETGQAVRQVAEILRGELAPLGLAVELKEKVLPPFAVEQSNAVFFDGAPVEELLGATVGSSSCPSCSDLLADGVDCRTDCRTVLVDGLEHEALPVELLLRAGREAVRRMKDKNRPPARHKEFDDGQSEQG